jgi:hypothetical protein
MPIKTIKRGCPESGISAEIFIKAKPKNAVKSTFLGF